MTITSNYRGLEVDLEYGPELAETVAAIEAAGAINEDGVIPGLGCRENIPRPADAAHDNDRIHSADRSWLRGSEVSNTRETRAIAQIPCHALQSAGEGIMPHAPSRRQSPHGAYARPGVLPGAQGG